MLEVLIVAATESLIVEGDGTHTLQVDGSIDLLEVAQQGPPGPPGATESGPSVFAGEALSGHRAVVLSASGTAIYADCGIPAHLGRFAGITAGAASIGAVVTCIKGGAMTEPSWAWTPDAPIYLGHTGLLTQVQPNDGFQQVLGVALSTTAIFINPREPISTTT